MARQRRRDESAPKTTRPVAVNRREPEPVRSAQDVIGRKLDAVPDRVDVRDWFYQPGLRSLPDVLVNCDWIADVLDQGSEGACTGFALASVINCLLTRRNLRRRVSPRMLYEMARRYDEWPGERYEGSSARGAMIGWARHGVCGDAEWPAELQGVEHFTPVRAKAARAVPGGAFYRVMHKQVRDMHAALADAGILYCTLMVHNGWDKPGPKTVNVTYVDSGNLCTRKLPVIQRRSNASDGHAVAIVGYTEDGFIILNSWGDQWGAGGFALLPYEDYLLHATDVWVAQLGVPVSADLWVNEGAADSVRGLHRATESIPLNQIRPYVIDVGNNGTLSDSGEYWTTKADVTRLFSEVIPERTKDWQKRRVLLYLHGGLNNEATTARRIIAFKEVMLANEIYPLHIMWETGAVESLKAIIQDVLVRQDQRAGGVAEWLEKTREGLLEAKDRTLELTVARPGTSLWNKMKENARLASERRDGAMQLIADTVVNAMAKLPNAEKNKWELHIVGHSAGSIFVAEALPILLKLGVPLKTVQFMAPALRVDEFKAKVLPHIKKGTCPQPTLYILSDVGELDDNVGSSTGYGKSLLYLVSNAFEGEWKVPILGMEKFITDRGVQPSTVFDPELNKLFKKQVDGWPSLVIAGESVGGPNSTSPSVSRSDSHGGFDNDEWTMNSVLHRILGAAPKTKFTQKDMQYDV